MTMSPGRWALSLAMRRRRPRRCGRWRRDEATTKNAARMPQINERNRLPWSALRCHRDRLSTVILAPFLAVEKKWRAREPASYVY